MRSRIGKDNRVANVGNAIDIATGQSIALTGSLKVPPRATVVLYVVP